MFKIIGGDGEEYGPVDDAGVREWIQEGRANAQTMLQREGQSNWAPLSSFPEFAPLLGGAPGQPVAMSPGQPIPEGTVPNYLVHSILLTLCCCPPFGIAAIVQASKVDALLAGGNQAAAKEASAGAKKWCIWALVIGAVVNILFIAINFSAGGF